MARSLRQDEQDGQEKKRGKEIRNPNLNLRILFILSNLDPIIEL